MKNFPLITEEEIIGFPHVKKFYSKNKNLTFADCKIGIFYNKKSDYALVVYKRENGKTKLLDFQQDIPLYKMLEIFNSIPDSYEVKKEFSSDKEEKLKDKIEFREDMQKLNTEITSFVKNKFYDILDRYEEKGLSYPEIICLWHRNCNIPLKGRDV